MARKPNKFSVELFAHCKSSMANKSGVVRLSERMVCKMLQKNRPRASGTAVADSANRSADETFCRASRNGPCESKSSKGEQAPCKTVHGVGSATNRETNSSSKRVLPSTPSTGSKTVLPRPPVTSLVIDNSCWIKKKSPMKGSELGCSLDG